MSTVNPLYPWPLHPNQQWAANIWKKQQQQQVAMLWLTCAM